MAAINTVWSLITLPLQAHDIHTFLELFIIEYCVQSFLGM